MIEAKTAHERSKERQEEIVAQHLRWFMVRAELAIEKAISNGRDSVSLDAGDLRIEAIEQGLAELEKIGYKTERVMGDITIYW